MSPPSSNPSHLFDWDFFFKNNYNNYIPKIFEEICKEMELICFTINGFYKFKDDFKNDLIFISMISPEVTYSLDNYERPFNIQLKTEANLINYKKISYNNIVFSEYESEDDIGNILESKRSQKELGISNRYKLDDIKEEPDIKEAKNFTEKQMKYFVCSISLNNFLYFYRLSLQKNRPYIYKCTILN